MKLFFYYAFHSTVNQIRKMLKTWVLIFLFCCALLGGAIGYGAARIEHMAEEQRVEEELSAQTVEEEEDASLPERLGLDTGELFELLGGVGMLLLFTFQALSAEKNGGRLFQSSDVNLLFASPMQPQSVLLFRLMTQLGTAVFMVFYLLLQLPNLTLNMGLSLPAALGLIVTLCAAVLTGKLLQVLLYTLSSTRPRLKRTLRYWIYAAVGAVGLGYVLCHLSAALPVWQSAAKYLNAPLTRYIPLWGFLKGFLRSMVDGQWLRAALFLGALLAAQGILIYIIWHMPADFYEDAMAKSEETAELRARAQAEQTTVSLGGRKKDRSESLLRDGLHHGWGSSVFLYKNLYNRRRFAHLGFLTKTTETYFLSVLAVYILCRRVVQADPFLPIVLTLAVFSYFRALGNPLETDTRMDFFLLIPESLHKKLLYSLLSAVADCLLDLLLPWLLVVALCPENWAEGLCYIPLILSIYLYATVVGAFIHLSVPVSADNTVKTIVQVMFVYFGLLPDIALMAVGIVTGRTLLALLGATGLNLLLSLVFFLLTPQFLDPYCPPAKKLLPYAGDLPSARRQFSRMGWALTVCLAGGSLLQLGLAGALTRWAEGWTEWPAALYLVTFAPLYLVAFPLSLGLLRPLPSAPTEKTAVGGRDAVHVLLVSIFFMYAGNLLGTLVTALLGLLTGSEVSNPLLVYVSEDSMAIKLLFFVVLAPLLEELLFRKMLIDRMRPHGERLAVVLSALLFGLFHGNLSQFFYAFALGLVFGYVYLRTARLGCTVALHMFINFLGGVVGPAMLEVLSAAGEESTALLSPAALFALYAALLLAAATAGMVIFFLRKREVRFAEDEYTLPRGQQLPVAMGNSGMLAFLLSALGLIVWGLL